jgi:spermidine/putrescine transport system substrate-binding protein
MKRFVLACVLLSGMAHAEDKLHLYIWNNYLSAETIKRFQASCRCEVIQDYYGSVEELLAKMAAGAKGYDILVPTGFGIPPLVKQGLLQPLNKNHLPNFKNQNPAFLNSVFDKDNRYSVPYAFTTTLVGFNVDKLKALNIDPGSWSVIFDPTVLAKIKGKVTVLDDPRELLAAALKYNGFSANSTQPAEWAKAKDTILKAKPYWAAFNNQSYIKELTVGNIWVAHGYSSDMFQAQQDAKSAKRKFSVSYTLQKEGNTLSVDSLVIPKAAPRPDLAHQFINFMLEGKNAADLTNKVGTGNPNAAAAQYVKPELKPVPAIFPSKAQMSKLEQLNDLDSKHRRELNRLWTHIKTQK